MFKHTVEKIGGTSMSNFDLLINNIFIGERTGVELYNRIFVVSAYGGITNMLLEHKKTGEPGVYALFASGDHRWKNALEAVEDEMCRINSVMAENAELNLEKAYAFVRERISGLASCLQDLKRVCSYGHFELRDYLPACREMLAAVGEAHSAYNSMLILQSLGVNAKFVDLSGWKEEETYPMEEKIRRAMNGIDLRSELPIVTGYTKCKEGIMGVYDRGYSEITFSKLAIVTGAKEGIIHKEFHLSTGDPNLIGVENVRIIGETNFDIADQLADLGMEAIHPKASKEMACRNISIRVKNAFDPKHPGTLISRDYISASPKVDMVLGKKDMLALEVYDPDMVGEPGYDHKILSFLDKYRISYIAKSTNANTITHYVDANAKNLEKCIEAIRKHFCNGTIRTAPIAMIAATGSNMKKPGFVAQASTALAAAHINILAFSQCMRQVNMQFIIEPNVFDSGIKVLHKALVEDNLTTI
ncbi:MAG: aspartate kinase [Lentisphaeria bacterium]